MVPHFSNFATPLIYCSTIIIFESLCKEVAKRFGHSKNTAEVTNFSSVCCSYKECRGTKIEACQIIMEKHMHLQMVVGIVCPSGEA